MSAVEQYAKNQPIRGNYMTGMDRILNMPRACVYRAAALNVATAAATATLFDTILYDTDGMWSATVGDRLIARTAGLYLVNGWMAFANSAAGTYRDLYILKNGTSPYGRLLVMPNTTGLGNYMSVSAQVALNAGDLVQLIPVQNSGGNLAMNVATATDLENAFQACLIST